MDKENLIDLLKTNKNIEELYQLIDTINIENSIPIIPYIFNKTKIYCDELYEIYIIYWKEGYASPIHSHAENGCILYLLDGSLEEIVYSDSHTIINSKEIKSNQKSFIKNSLGFHKIKANKDSISLHIYSPPNSNITIY